jgi:thymidylate synthase (FAD)
MPRLVPEGQTCDFAIAEMARTSYADGTKQVSDDRNLIRHLMRHKHTSPFEGVEFKFFIKLPLFVQGQLIRHRTANVNQESARYSMMADEFYEPKQVRTQSQDNKQGSEITLSEQDSEKYYNDIKEHAQKSYQIYEKMLADGLTREQARMVLPQNLYTKLIWKCDLHNILHFLALRCDSHAQWEIRQYANAMLELITPLVPWTIEAWNEYNPMRNATIFTEKECNKLSYLLGYIEFDESTPTTFDLGLDSGNKREDKEWIEKLKKVTKLEV